MKERSADLAIVGAGIVGLAHALAAARQGLRVVLFERSAPAVGASIRNFGLLWPVGQPAGSRHDRAIRSREIWGEVTAAAGLHWDASGSLHLAYHDDEWTLLEEFAATPLGSGYGRRLIQPAEAMQMSPAINPVGLRGALWSPTEATIDPPQAVRALPGWLEAAHGVQLQFGTTVQSIHLPVVETTMGSWHIERTIVCSGPDFETLYPQVYAEAGLTRCKLQMLRTLPQSDGWKLGPALCAGLTLTHYDSFKDCRSLAPLQARFRAERRFCVEHGIHVLLAQTASGALTIGDSHHYGLTVNPFDRTDIDREILAYLQTFARVPSLEIAERWQGVYPKLPKGGADLVISPEPNVWVVNGLGGAGMTLAFGLAEEVMTKL